MKSLVLAFFAACLQDAPSPESVRKARESLRESLKEDLAKGSPAARQALAHRLAVAAKAEPDAAVRAAYLLEAVDRAADAGDLHVASMALAELRKIAGAWPAARARVLDLREKKEKPGALCETWFGLALECLDAGEYDLAVQSSERAEAAAVKRGDPSLPEPVRDLRDAARRAQKEFEAVRPQAARLLEDPADPAANEAVGRFTCFVRGRWDVGLPMLARGSDAGLRSLAECDRGAGEALALKLQAGDLWWEWAEKQAGKIPKDGGRERAAHWYEQARQGVLEKSARARVEKRVRTHYESLGPGPGGNVALARWGARVTGATRGEELLDGVTEGYTGTTGHALSPIPSEWVVTLPRVYPLRQVRLLLWDNDDRFYRYAIESSADGHTYDLLVNPSEVPCRGWQVHSFAARPVRTIRIRGLHNSAIGFFHAVEFEAYCRPPPSSPKPK